MRKILVHLLILVMLTPSLACGPFMPGGRTHAAKAMPACHGMTAHANTHGTMLFKDCAKIDLQDANHAILKKPDAGKTFFLALTDAPERNDLTNTDFHDARGPPPDTPAVSQTKPSILLTTQRFRE